MYCHGQTFSAADCRSIQSMVISGLIPSRTQASKTTFGGSETDGFLMHQANSVPVSAMMICRWVFHVSYPEKCQTVVMATIMKGWQWLAIIKSSPRLTAVQDYCQVDGQTPWELVKSKGARTGYGCRGAGRGPAGAVGPAWVGGSGAGSVSVPIRTREATGRISKCMLKSGAGLRAVCI
jgi:hypothetical protein